jgi:hypothetical protein
LVCSFKDVRNTQSLIDFADHSFKNGPIAWTKLFSHSMSCLFGSFGQKSRGAIRSHWPYKRGSSHVRVYTAHNEINGSPINTLIYYMNGLSLVISFSVVAPNCFDSVVLTEHSVVSHRNLTTLSNRISTERTLIERSYVITTRRGKKMH